MPFQLDIFNTEEYNVHNRGSPIHMAIISDDDEDSQYLDIAGINSYEKLLFPVHP